MRFRICLKCGTYTLKNVCPKCGANTSDFRTLKYSPQDPLMRFRIEYKQKLIDKHEL